MYAHREEAIGEHSERWPLQAKERRLQTPCQHLDLGLQPPEVWEVHFCCSGTQSVTAAREDECSRPGLRVDVTRAVTHGPTLSRTPRLV